MGKSGYIPKAATLDGFVEIAEKLSGVNIARLESGTKLVAQTATSTYTILVVDPVEREVVVTGGKLAGPEKCVLSGASFGGSFLKIGCIMKQMRMELRLDDGSTLSTSPVQKIFSESMRVTPNN